MATRIGRTRMIAALALGVLWCWAAVAGPPREGDPAAWVERRVQDWQPTAEERRFDEIGWAADIRTAERLAREHRRPVFLFTYDGVSMAGRRC
jgi:hypothetical protein